MKGGCGEREVLTEPHRQLQSTESSSSEGHDVRGATIPGEGQDPSTEACGRNKAPNCGCGSIQPAVPATLLHVFIVRMVRALCPDLPNYMIPTAWNDVLQVLKEYKKPPN
jgi:hypothetical protein